MSRLASPAVGALLAALEARDGTTGEHSRDVARLAVQVARELGLPSHQIADLERAALLHDVGKIGVSDAVLLKRGALTGDEWREMKRHPEIGEEIVASVPGLTHLTGVIRAEHERWDGRGYPDGLSGERIPLCSRIVFACDAYHAMVTDRPYRQALEATEAQRELSRSAGSQLCPRAVGALLTVLHRTKTSRRTPCLV